MCRQAAHRTCMDTQLSKGSRSHATPNLLQVGPDKPVEAGK